MNTLSRPGPEPAAETPVAPYTDEAAIRSVGTRFAAATLPKAEWTHAAHFAAALWLLRCCPDCIAEEAMPGMIRRYNEAVGTVNGDHSGYHETLTLALLRGTRAFLLGRAADEPLPVTLAALLGDPLADREWALTYWTRACLFAPEARRHWVEPDRKPLPF